MREKEIEKKLTQMVKKAGGICPKLVSPGFDGMPDRMVLLPNGRIGFCNMSRPARGAWIEIGYTGIEHVIRIVAPRKGRVD